MSTVIKCFLALALYCAMLAQAGTLALVADLNGRYGSTDYHPRIGEAVAAIIKLQPEAVVIAGDMIAGQVKPPLAHTRLDAMWASFERLVHRPLRAAGIRVLAVPGNHDASIYPAYAGERRAYDEYWRPYKPDGLSEGSNFPWYYGVELTSATLVGLDVTAPADLSPEQVEFLRRQREAAVAADRKLVVVTHLPRYPVAVGRERETFTGNPTPLPGEVWISGHHHAFYAGLTPDGGLQLSLPPLGGNRRAWLGSSDRGPFGFVTLTPDGTIALHADPSYEAATAGVGPAEIGMLKRTNSPSRHTNAVNSD